LFCFQPCCSLPYKLCSQSHDTHSLPALSKSNCSNKFDFHKQLVCISRATSLVRTQCPNITSNNPTSVNYVQWIFGGIGRGQEGAHSHNSQYMRMEGKNWKIYIHIQTVSKNGASLYSPQF